MAKDKLMDEYVPVDPLTFLSEFKEQESLREDLLKRFPVFGVWHG